MNWHVYCIPLTLWSCKRLKEHFESSAVKVELIGKRERERPIFCHNEHAHLATQLRFRCFANDLPAVA